MQSSMADSRRGPLDDTAGYHIEFDVHAGRPTLTLVGDLDAAATDALRGILSCVEDASGPVHVDARGVLGADADAFDPLFEFARTRQAQHRPGVVVDTLSDAVQDLFRILTLPVHPPVELGPDLAEAAS